MAVVIIRSTVGGLVRDMKRIPSKAEVGFRKATEGTAKKAHRATRKSAAKKSGRHGKWFPSAIDIEKVDEFNYQIFTDPEKPQGDMNFEAGPGPQTRPHNNFKLGHDVVVAEFPRAVKKTLDGLYW